MLNAQKVTANSSFFLSALVIQKVLSFVYFTILASSIGVASTGRYFFAISFATMFSVLMDLGLSPVLTREVARKSSDEKMWFQQIFSLKIIFTLLTVLILLAINFFLFAGDPVQELVYLAIAIVVIDSFTLLFYAYIRGQQNLKFEAAGTIIFQLIVMTLGLGLLFFTKNLLLIIGVLLLASLFNLIFSMTVLNIKFKTKLSFLWRKDLVLKILLVTWPFAMSAIFAKIYAYLDTFLLKLFLDDTAVGFYSVAYKITFAWQFIPLGLVAALYPAFAHFFVHDKVELEKVFNKGFTYLALIALPILSGIIVLAPEIILKIYNPEFSGSILPLQVLIASLAFLFMNFALSNLLNAANLQKTNTRNLGLTMLFNLVFNLIFIPLIGVWGAALASSLSTLLLFTLNLKASLSVVKINKQNIKNIILAIFTSLIMALLVWFLKSVIWWPLTIVCGAIFYFGFLFITKILTWQEIKYWRASIFKKI